MPKALQPKSKDLPEKILSGKVPVGKEINDLRRGKIDSYWNGFQAALAWKCGEGALITPREANFRPLNVREMAKEMYGEEKGHYFSDGFYEGMAK